MELSTCISLCGTVKEWWQTLFLSFFWFPRIVEREHFYTLPFTRKILVFLMFSIIVLLFLHISGSFLKFGMLTFSYWWSNCSPSASIVFYSFHCFNNSLLTLSCMWHLSNHQDCVKSSSTLQASYKFEMSPKGPGDRSSQSLRPMHLSLKVWLCTHANNKVLLIIHLKPSCWRFWR